MGKIKKIYLSVKTKVGNRFTNIKGHVKKNYQKACTEPRSKRKSLLLGFTTVFGIFGVTLLSPVLAAVAKDLPKGGPKPGSTDLCPSPQPAALSSTEIIKGLKLQLYMV